MNEKEIIKKSRFLSLVLRHKPEEIELELDNNGWANVKDLLDKCSKKGIKLDFENLNIIVDTNNKKRFTFNDDFTKIRANQGHSINIEMDYKESEPPSFLYHGTSDKNSNLILDFGIKKMQRQYVHLSFDIETALNVGKR
ncbi:MAG: RNA 2'-phosphotransferase, partial [Candidatus Sericytochromatia bacterium]